MKFAIAYGFAWVATAAAVIVGITTTGKVGSLFFLLIPAMLRLREDDK